MRIEAYTKVQQVYKTKKASSTNNTSKADFADAVEISSIGKDIQVAKQAVAASSDVREELIAPLKESIKAGTYSVSAEQLASKLLGESANN